MNSLLGEKASINQSKQATMEAERASIIEKIQADLLEEKIKTGKTPSKEDLKVVITREEYNKGELGTDCFITKVGEYTINYNEILGWQNYIKIEELNAGDYVDYIDKNGNIIKCIVLYDQEYNKSNNVNYGIQIISEDCVGTLSFGYVDETITGESEFEKAKNSYNNALKKMYAKAQEYINTSYVTAARSFGSNPGNPDWETVEMFNAETGYDDFNRFNNIFKIGDENFTTDYSQIMLLDLDIVDIDKEYCMASRNIKDDNKNNRFEFGIWYIDNSGNKKTYPICITGKEGLVTSATEPVLGYRPVFTLKSNVKVVDGEGTRENPYKLEI